MVEEKQEYGVEDIGRLEDVLPKGDSLPATEPTPPEQDKAVKRRRASIPKMQAKGLDIESRRAEHERRIKEGRTR